MCLLSDWFVTGCFFSLAHCPNDNHEWGVWTGGYKKPLLIDPFELDSPVYIRVAYGSRLTVTHQCMVELNFKSDEGFHAMLKLMRVLYVPGL